VPDKVWKEIYGVKDGKIVLLKTVNGRHEPAKRLDERFIFEDAQDG
jgi:hypothetical protein